MRGRALRARDVRGSGTSLGWPGCRCRRRHERCPKAPRPRPSCASACSAAALRARLRAEPPGAEPQPRCDRAHRVHGARDREPRRGARAARRRGRAAGGRLRARVRHRRGPRRPRRGLPARAAPAAHGRLRDGARRRRGPRDPEQLERVTCRACSTTARSSGSTRRACCSTTRPSARDAGGARCCAPRPSPRRVRRRARRPCATTSEVERGLRAGLRRACRTRSCRSRPATSRRSTAASARVELLRGPRRADGARRGQRPGRPRRDAGAARAAAAAGPRRLAGVRGGAADPAAGRPAGRRHQLGLRRGRRARSRELLLQRLEGGPAERVVVRDHVRGRARRAPHRRPPASLDIERGPASIVPAWNRFQGRDRRSADVGRNPQEEEGHGRVDGDGWGPWRLLAVVAAIGRERLRRRR